MKRTAFFISDSTGITAEAMGESLLSHFPSIEFERRVLSYVDTTEKAEEAAKAINETAIMDGTKPIIFETLVSQELRDIVTTANGFSVDVINTFLKPLESELGAHSVASVGRPKIATENARYSQRMQAVHFALENDDGARTQRYNEADLILIGVSRSGKTPTCLYLAMQYGVFAANYPITEEDLESFRLPRPLKPYKTKLFGLTISPDRLAAIREERLANTRYSSVAQCEQEVREIEQLYDHYNIRSINSTDISVEEIAARILVETGIKRRF